VAQFDRTCPFDRLRAASDGRLEYNLLFRWFVGIGVEDAAWDHSVFSKNRHRLLESDVDGSGDPDR
jgi:Transposase domain (DUF772)